MSVTDLMVNGGSSVYYEPGYRRMIETCLPFLSTDGAKYVSIEPMKVFQYQGDFFGLLEEHNVDFAYRWIYMRINGMHNSLEFGRDLDNPLRRERGLILTFPDHQLIETLTKKYLTEQR